MHHIFVLCIVLRMKGSKAQIVSPIRTIIFDGAKEIYLNLDDIIAFHLYELNHSNFFPLNWGQLFQANVSESVEMPRKGLREFCSSA